MEIITKLSFFLPNVDDRYSIDINGNVYSKNKNGVKLLKYDTIKGGYKRVTLAQNGDYKRHIVHRLVAICFIENAFNKPFVNHLNGNKSDNNVSNLEWCTSSENEKHSYNVLGKISPCAKKVIDGNGSVYSSIAKAAKAHGIKPKTLNAILNGQTKTNNTSCKLLSGITS
jgi:hypothetical protein